MCLLYQKRRNNKNYDLQITIYEFLELFIRKS